MTLAQLRYVITVSQVGTLSEAAKRLYISQPSLTNAIKELEKELGITIFIRTNKGVILSRQGEEFLGYARQMVEQYRLLEDRFINKQESKKRFSVSMQHYTFAVQAFIEMAKQFDMEDYEFAVHETKTYEVIENVKSQKSELGILYLNDFNEKALDKIFRDNELEFHELFSCSIYVYLAKSNPLSKKKKLTFEDLRDYPCLSFDQGHNNSFYLAEEVFSTYEYKQIIKANDRATLLNLMVGLNAYTLCSGIICEELNGSDYDAIPLDVKDKMRIGYIKKMKMPLSTLGQKYLEELKKMERGIL